MILRDAQPGDAASLADFARDAFGAAFAHLYKPEDLSSFYAEWRTQDVYRKAIGDPDVAIRLAMLHGKIAAYCLLVRGKTFEEHPDPRPENPALLSQLYCAEETTGKGYGAALMRWAIDHARSEWGSDALVLSVFSENFGAQRFYQRHGFRHIADIDFWVGNHRDDEFLYEFRL